MLDDFDEYVNDNREEFKKKQMIGGLLYNYLDDIDSEDQDKYRKMLMQATKFAETKESKYLNPCWLIITWV